jgi:hypothetical protein
MMGTCCNAAMSPPGQEWPITNRSLGSRRSEADGQEVPTTRLAACYDFFSN